MAGGEGARLRPYTVVLPKPLMPIGDRPVLDIVVRQLRAADFERITIATGYLAELIEAFFRDGQAYDVAIDYFREYEPLGTVGALALIDGLDEPFLVMNGDVLTDMDYTALLEHHVASGAAVTVAATRRHVNISLGVMEFDDATAPSGSPTTSRSRRSPTRCRWASTASPRACSPHRAQRAARLPGPHPAAARARRARRGVAAEGLLARPRAPRRLRAGDAGVRVGAPPPDAGRGAAPGQP